MLNEALNLVVGIIEVIDVGGISSEELAELQLEPEPGKLLAP